MSDPNWFMKFCTWLRRTVGGMVTEHDNKTHDLIKHGGWIGLVALFAQVHYQEVSGIHTAPKDFAMAIGIILGACGAGVALKRGSEHNDGGDNA